LSSRASKKQGKAKSQNSGFGGFSSVIVSKSIAYNFFILSFIFQTISSFIINFRNYLQIFISKNDKIFFFLSYKKA
jgi:hypothetical protein